MSEEIRKNKMLRDILVVKSEHIHEKIGNERPGFIHHKDTDLESVVLEHFEYQQRGKMEEDTSYQQPIPYVLIYNPDIDKFVAFQRGGKDSASGEKRLFGKWSLGVGGHIEKEQEKDKNPILSTMYKEIEEEIGLTDIDNVHLIGYIVDGSVPVNNYHMGFIYLVETHTREIMPVDGELSTVVFLSKDEVEEIIVSPEADLESRSYMVWDAYKNNLK